MEEVPKHIWEKRVELLRKAKEGNLDFREFCLLDMHKETTDLLGRNGGLSEKGLATLCAIETYLSSIPPSTKDAGHP